MADEKSKEQDKKDTKKETGSTSKTVEKLVDEIAKLSVMELSELVNALQDKLGVTAAAPVAAVAAPAAGGGDAPAGGEEAGGGTVVMTGVGENKIAAIKAIREIDQNITLKDAKDMTENLPAEILKDAKAEEAKVAVEKLKAAGCTVEVK
jgi:large subunit ribosomal protein L7/L12